MERHSFWLIFSPILLNKILNFCAIIFPSCFTLSTLSTLFTGKFDLLFLDERSNFRYGKAFCVTSRLTFGRLS